MKNLQKGFYLLLLTSFIIGCEPEEIEVPVENSQVNDTIIFADTGDQKDVPATRD